MPTVISIVLTGDEKQLEASLRRGEVAIQRMRQETEKNANLAFKAHQQQAQGVNMVTASLTNLAGALGVTLGAGAILVYIKNLVTLGDRLSDLSDATGISIKTLGGLRPIVESAGLSIEDFATGMRAMMRSLIEANDPTSKQAEALKKLGISTNDMLRFMSDPDGFILAYAKGLAQLPTVAERLTVAQELGAKAGAKQLAIFMEIAEKGLPQLSEETEKAYKRMGQLADSFIRGSATVADFTATIIGRFLKQFGMMAPTVDEAQKKLEHLKRFMASDTAAIAKAQKDLADAQALAAEALIKPPPGKPGPDPKFIEERAKALEKLRDRLADVTSEFFKLSDPQRAALEQIQKLEKDVSKFNDPIVRNLIESIKLWTLAGIEQKKSMEEQEAEQKRLSELIKQQIQAINEWEKAELERGKAIIDAGILEKELEIERLELMGDERQARLRIIELTEQQAKMHILEMNIGIDAQNRLLDKLKENTDLRKEKLEEELIKAKEVTINIGQEISRAVGDAFQGVILGTSKLADVGKNLFAALLRSSAEFFVNVLNKKLGFEQLIFSNLRGFPAQANAVLASGAVTVPGGGGGGGGFLSSIGGIAGPFLSAGGGGLIGGGPGGIAGSIISGIGSLATPFIANSIGGMLAAGAATTSAASASALAGGLGATIGGALSFAVPVVGGILGGLFGGLFGGPSKHKQLSPQRRAAAASAGLSAMQGAGFVLTQDEANLLSQMMQVGGGPPMEQQSTALNVAHLEALRAKRGKRTRGDIATIQAILESRGLPGTGSAAEIFAAATKQQEQAAQATIIAQQASEEADKRKQIAQILDQTRLSLEAQVAEQRLQLDMLGKSAEEAMKMRREFDLAKLAAQGLNSEEIQSLRLMAEQSDELTRQLQGRQAELVMIEQKKREEEEITRRFNERFLGLEESLRRKIEERRFEVMTFGLAPDEAAHARREFELTRLSREEGFTPTQIESLRQLMEKLDDLTEALENLKNPPAPTNVEITIVSNDPEEFGRRLGEFLNGRTAPPTG